MLNSLVGKLDPNPKITQSSFKQEKKNLITRSAAKKEEEENRGYQNEDEDAELQRALKESEVTFQLEKEKAQQVHKKQSMPGEKPKYSLGMLSTNTKDLNEVMR